MSVLIHLAAVALTVLGLAKVLPGIKVTGPLTAVLVALVFSVLNGLLGPLLKGLLFLPALLSLGLLLPFLGFIVNAFLLWATDKLIKRFEILDLGTLLISAGAITAVSFVIRHTLP